MLYSHAQKIETQVMGHDTITLGDIIRLIGGDSILVVLIFLSVLNIILSPLPFNSVVMGIPLFVFSIFYWMNLDVQKHRLSLFDKRFNCQSWRKYIQKFVPYISKFETVSAPRWRGVLLFENRMLSGLSLSLLALVIFLPIPFANVPGSIGIILICLGVLQRDGLFILSGYFIFALHIVAIAMLGYSLAYL